MSTSLENLENQLDYVDQLIEIHEKMQQGPGRRHRQDALHRSGVVLTVAAWQAYVESLLKEVLNIIEVSLYNQNPSPPQWVQQVFSLQKGNAFSELGKFNTPNSQKTENLFLKSIGFEPWASIAWKSGRRDWNSAEIKFRTDAWLRIRHAIAHGFSLPPNIKWINGDNGRPRLNLKLLKECKAHFLYVATYIDLDLKRFVIRNYQIQNPW